MVIELELPHLRPTVQQEQFPPAVEATTVWLKEQDGFVRRVIGKDEQGQWADMVYWTSREAAEQAGSSLMSAPEAQHYMALLVPERLQRSHFQTMVESD